jgi:hypothetical protein
MIDRAEALGVAGVGVVTTADLLALTLRAACDPAWRRCRALRDLADIVLQGGDLLETSLRRFLRSPGSPRARCARTHVGGGATVGEQDAAEARPDLSCIDML